MFRRFLIALAVVLVLMVLPTGGFVIRADGSLPATTLDFNTVFGLGSTSLFLIVLVVLAFAAGHAHGWQVGLAKADEVIQQAANNPAFIEAVKGAAAGVSPDVVNRILSTTETLAGVIVQYLPPGSQVRQLIGDAEKLAEEVAAPPPADKPPVNLVQGPVAGGAA